MAKELHVSTRTIQRWTGVLIRSRFITLAHRSRRSAIITVLEQPAGAQLTLNFSTEEVENYCGNPVNDCGSCNVVACHLADHLAGHTKKSFGSMESLESLESTSPLAEECSQVEAVEQNPKVAASQLARFGKFVYSQTRFYIGGKMADAGTVRLLAQLLRDERGWDALRVKFRAWCRTRTPQTWGIVVEKAREVASERCELSQQETARRAHVPSPAASWNGIGIDIRALAEAKRMPEPRRPTDIHPRVRAAVIAIITGRDG